MMRESVIYQEIRAEGKAEGIQQGEVNLILRLLKRRIGELDPQFEEYIHSLSVAKLEELGEAL